MNIEISSGSLWNSSRYFEFKIEITGAGTIDDPYLLSTKNQFSTESYEVRISDSSKYIKFSGFSLKAVYLRQCKNVRISKARIQCLGLGKCSMISVHNVDILKQLRLEQVHKIKFTNSKIKKLFAFSGDQILISNCNIKRISRKSEALIYVHNKNNTRNLENNSIQIPQQVKQNFLVCRSCETEVDLFSRFCHDCGSMLK